MLSMVDRARLELFVQRLEYHLSDLPGARRRQIRREVRANTLAAAADVGMRQALANLGQPRVLAGGYVAAEGRPLPRYRSGALWAGAVLLAWFWTVLAYAVGLADGGRAAGELGERVVTSFLGATVEASGGDFGFSVNFDLGVALLVYVGVFLVASRSWRALPPVRRRLARSSGTTG